MSSELTKLFSFNTTPKKYVGIYNDKSSPGSSPHHQ
jgi:hypothetical protein